MDGSIVNENQIYEQLTNTPWRADKELVESVDTKKVVGMEQLLPL